MRRTILVVAVVLSFINAQSQSAYPTKVLTIGALDNAPAYIYIDTNIPATDWAAPQLQITGYMYATTNRAMKVTLGWYYFAQHFYWTQYQSDIGYNKPNRIRLGTYLKNGTKYIRIEIANNSVYWTNYTISATDRSESFLGYYSGWTYAEGEMPASTSEITVVDEQMDVTISGKLGIGTVSPDYLLTPNLNLADGSTGTISRFYINKGQPNAAYLQIGGTSHPLASARRMTLDVYDGANTPQSLVLQSNGGSVGIGTTSPNLGQLHISGNANSATPPNRPRIALEDIAGGTQWLIQPWSATGGDGNFAILRNAGVGNIILGGSGINVGIGTNYPAEKLSVNGNISAKKIIVTQTGWSDYVFSADYKLRSLSDVEAFVKRYKHLPEMPSAKEVEEKGISVGDTQALLLKKIEELTLHMIVMKKEIALLKKNKSH